MVKEAENDDGVNTVEESEQANHVIRMDIFIEAVRLVVGAIQWRQVILYDPGEGFPVMMVSPSADPFVPPPTDPECLRLFLPRPSLARLMSLIPPALIYGKWHLDFFSLNAGVASREKCAVGWL